jgi:heavy metal sensor kinase
VTERWIRHVRSRLTLWYVGVLGGLLLLYAGGASVFLFYSLRNQLDRAVDEDVETVESLLVETADGGVTMRALPEEDEDADRNNLRIVEVWSPEGSLLYRTPALEGGALGGPPQPGEGEGRTAAETRRVGRKLRVRMISTVYRLNHRRVVLRVAHSEERVFHELEEFFSVLLPLFPLALILAGLGGYTLARKALAPIDVMAQRAERISAERLSERLPVENPEDELGHLAGVCNAMLGRLEAGFEQLRRFTADASHELRSPLTAIRSVGEVGLQEQKSAEEYRDVIGSMLEETDRLTHLVDSLLVLSRAEAGNVNIHPARVSLLEVAKEAVSLLDVLAEEKRQRILVEGDAAVAVNADRILLRQAAVNLIDNAIKYSPPSAEILVRARCGADRQAILEVIDQGSGVPREHQAKIFDRFYRVDSGRAREQGGAGLGLAIARWAVEVHGGHSELESEEGKGSTFRLVLPRAEDSVPQAAPPEAS